MSVYNNELKSRNFIVPGLIAVILMIIAALLTSLTIAREWENGTMEQLLSTPVRPMELLLGKLCAYFVLGMADMVIALIVGVGVFGVPLRGSVLLLAAGGACSCSAPSAGASCFPRSRARSCWRTRPACCPASCRRSCCRASSTPSTTCRS